MKGRWIARTLALLALLFAGCSGEIQPSGVTPPASPVATAGAAGMPAIAPMCGAGQSSCATGCVNSMVDTANCGGCGIACAAGQTCNSGVCTTPMMPAGCAIGLMQCPSGCVDITTDEANCGMCGQACPAGRMCVASNCICAPDQMDCGGACVNTQTDGANCGACGTACTQGRTCQAGMCQCMAGQQFCTDQCADTLTNAAHCGGCGMACGAGQTCVNGACACGAGQMLCGTTCVDTMVDSANCGGCGTACPLGQSCVAGLCGGGGMLEDGCAGPAQGVTLSQITVYQSVEVPIMRDGAEMAAATRNTSVIAGKDALVVVAYTAAQGFTGRELSARVYLDNAGVSSMYFAKRMVSGSSTENPETGFQVTVPKAAINADTTYAVEVAECGGTPSGGALSPRFPATGSLALAARVAGTLKMLILPVDANDRLPDVTESALAVYRDAMLATYPVSEVIMTVGDTMPSGYPIDWEGLLDDTRAKRQADDAPDDVYYYSLLAPEESFREFCNNSCTAGIGYVPGGGGGGFGGGQASARAAVGIGWADESSAMTMVHEVGHNHGRNHSPCVQGGSIAGVDQNYPYDGGILGIWGYDSRSGDFLDPEEATDVMGYCSDKWPSDYTYEGFLETILEVNGNQSVYVAPGALATWQVMLVGARGARWGAPIDEPSLPFGSVEQAEVLDAAGAVVELIDVYRTPVSDIDSFTILVPSPEPGWAAVHVLGAPVLAFPTASPTR